jgi:hypothetical protein
MIKDKTDTDVFLLPLPRKVIRKIFSFLSTDSSSPHAEPQATPYQPQSQIQWVDFQTLLLVSRVSRGWHEAVTRFLARSTALDLCTVFSPLTPTDSRFLSTIVGVNSLLRRCAQLHCVCLRNCAHAAAATLHQLAETHTESLSKLFLEGCTGLTDSVLYSINTTFPKLTFLDVSRTSVTHEGLCEYLQMQEFVEGVSTSLSHTPELARVLQVCLSTSRPHHIFNIKNFRRNLFYRI